MRSIRLVAIILAVLVGLSSCSRDPLVVKKRYLESGNKYFDKGRYKEASIQYRNALKRDPKYGPAHYKLALVSLKTGDAGGAVNALRRAVELIPPDQPDHWDSVVKLAEIYVAVSKGADSEVTKEAQALTASLIKHDPNSFDAHRLIGDLNYAKATTAYGEKQPESGALLLADALKEYRTADSIKPNQQLVLIQLARTIAARGDFSTAETIYRRVIQNDKTYQYPYTELYRMFLFQRKLADGEQILKLGFENNPKQFGFLSLLAAHYYGQQRRDDMVGVLNRIKGSAKDFDLAYITVGDFYLRLGDVDSAIREYKEGIAKDPKKDPKKKNTLQKHIIEALMRQGKRSEAAEVNTQILKETPDDNDARGLAATFLLDSGDIAKALAELQVVVTRAPDNPVSHFNLGRAHAARGEYEQARQQLQKAIELRADYAMARLALAQLQLQHGDYDAATKTAQTVLDADKGNVKAHLIQSAALMGMKKFADSRVMLESMLKVNPGSPDVLFQLGVVSLAQSKFKDAEDGFRRSYQLNPADTRGLMGVVESYMVQNRSEDALKLLQTESDKSPNRSDLLMAIGNTAVRSGRFDLALQTYNRMLGLMDKGQNPGDIYLRIGEVYKRKGDSASAIQALEKARQNQPENVAVLTTLAMVLDAALRRDEAKKIYEKTLQLDPNNPIVLNNLAFLTADSGGDLNTALTQAQRAKQLMPSLFEISDTLGWVYLKKNLAEEAIDIFKDLVIKAPNQPTFHFHLGMAYQQKGDKAKALDQYKEALKYNPPAPEKEKIQQLIAKLG